MHSIDLRKLACCATIFSLVLTQASLLGGAVVLAEEAAAELPPALPTSQVVAGGSCSRDLPATDGKRYPDARRLALDAPLAEILSQPERVRVLGDRPAAPPASISTGRRDVDTTGRWLPGYRPNTIEAWREFEAWKTDQRRSLRDNSVSVPSGIAGTSDNGSTIEPPNPAAGNDDAPVAVVRDQHYSATTVDVRDLGEDSGTKPDRAHPEERVESADPKTGLPWDEYIRLKEEARFGPDTSEAQIAAPRRTESIGFQGVSFDAIAATGSVPPDPIMTAGPSHLVALVNQSYRVWDKSGVPLINEISLFAFFLGVPNCESPFDVFVDYDEEHDRFVMGGMNFDGANTHICIAATQTGDPAALWNRYSFRADALLPTTGIDYPHTAIGLDAVYIGGNMFNDSSGAYDSSRIFAVDKTAMYDGDPIQVAEFGISTYRTPQPAKIRGFNTGQWPAPGTPQHIVTQESGSNSVRIYRWTDPFVNNPTVYGDVVTTYLGVPPNAPESGDAPFSPNLNDTSAGPLLDAEVRDGALWATRTVFCNIGGGDTEACIDWFSVDVSGPSPALLDQQAGGAFGSADEFRYYPDLGVDRNGNMAIAYTKSSFSNFTEIWAAGREASDPAGTLQSEVLQVAGAGNYQDSVGCGGTCDRWGDYTGMATDPDGCTFWYIGEYSDGGVEFGPWKTHIASYKFDSCSIDSAVGSDKGTYNCNDSMEIVVRDGTPIDAATVAAQTVVTSSSDSETIAAADWFGTECTGASCNSWTATLVVSGTASSNNDGTLSVLNGETVTIDYTDPHGGHASQTREASVSCQTRIEDGGFLIGGGCEGSSGGEVYRDYIDAGEYVQYVFGLFNPDSAPQLTDLDVTLNVTGPLAGLVSIGDPTIRIGSLGPGQLTGAVFDIHLDPAAAGSGLSENDFNLTLTSTADGFDVPQVLTQTQLLQTDDEIVTESQCFNMETDEGFESSTYVESYVCSSGPCANQTVTSIAAPWVRGPGCGSETRDDVPEITCDVNGSFAYTFNDSSVSCGVHAQANLEFASDVLYSPIITPVHTGNAANGQPWFYAWQFAEWFYRSDIFTIGIEPATAFTQLWADDYTGGPTPGTNDIDAFPYWMGNFFSYSNQDWDSATPWDPDNFPANFEGINLLGAGGEARPGLQWRWAIWQRDFDAFIGRTPIATDAAPGVAFDDLNLVYEQYHAIAQTTTCAVTDVPGVVSFDQLAYTGCSGGAFEVRVLDGNGAGPVTVTVTADATGDSESLTLTGAAPNWSATLSYSMDSGVNPDDGVLFVTPGDTVRASYADANPAAVRSTTAFIDCPGQSVVVAGLAGIDDSGNGGDADGIPDTNEIVDFTLTLRNDGDFELNNVEATIWTDDPDIDCITKDTATFGTLSGSGGSGNNDLVSDPFTFKVSNSAQCVDPSNPLTATFHVFITADSIDGADTPQLFSFELDLEDLGNTLELSEDFDVSQPVGWSHAVGPGDDDGVVGNGAAGLPCGPYNDDWFWSATGGSTGGGFFCWQDPADSFPSGRYSDNMDAVLDSAVVTIPAQGTGLTLTFDHEHKLADAGSTSGGRFALDGTVVQYNVNGGPWMKVTDLTYDTTVFFNTYCNPVCNGGDEMSGFTPPSQQDCFHEDPGNGERVFNLLGNARQDWTTVSGNIRGVTAGDQVRFRWRVGSMNSDAIGASTIGGYGLDNVSIEANRFQCDNAVRPDVGCGLVFDGAGNFAEVCGNGNGIVESNEQWDVDVTLKKLGEGDAVATMADLEINLGSAVNATITGSPQAYGTIPQRGGTATATYRFEVEASPACVDDIAFDVTNISDTSQFYPDEDAAFDTQVGGVAVGETGLQQTNPAAGTNSTGSAALTPAFAQTGPVDLATVSYGFDWSGGGGTEVAAQDTDPLTATNGDAISTLSAAFTIADNFATSATVDWTSLTSPGESADACTSVFLDAPNATRTTLKAQGAADNSPYDVLSFYQTHGPGTYSIVVNERSGGGCNSDGILVGTTMTVTGSATGDWVNNARVSLVNGGSSTVLKEFGQADANPYDVTGFYNVAGAGTYEIRVEENAGGIASVESATLSAQTFSCGGSCSLLPAPPPVADGVVGNPMTAARGAGADDVDISFDVGTCAEDHAVVVYGNFGDFSAYQGEVATGCDAGATGTASFTQSGSYWFNVIWVNGNNAAGSPGSGTAGARAWTAGGFCAVASDDHSDQVCN